MKAHVSRAMLRKLLNTPETLMSYPSPAFELKICPPDQLDSMLSI